MDAPAPVAPAEKSPILYEIAAVILFGLVLLMAFVIGAQKTKDVTEHIGYTFAPLIILLIIFGIARLMGKGKTRRSRALIAFWTGVVMFLGQCGSVGRLAEGKRAALPIEGPAAARDLRA